MSYLLDTCLVSELTKTKPAATVEHWIQEQRESDLYISAITLTELKYGIVRLPEGKKKHRLDAWLMNDLVARFSHRFLAITPPIALEYGTRAALLKNNGIHISYADGLIGTTAALHSLVLVTRNTKDFEPLGISLFNPWTDTD